MLETLFDSRVLPVPDRVEAWREITACALIPNEFSIDRAAQFHASLRAADFGAAQVTALTYASMRSRRTPRLIRQSDPEMYAVGLITSGEQAIAQGRTHTPLTVGDLVVYSTSHPYEAFVDAPRTTAGSVVVQLPRTDLRLPPDRVERLLASRLSGRESTGRLLAGFLTELSAGARSSCPPAARHRLGGVLTDLITAYLAGYLDTADRTPADTRGHVLYLEILDFIRRHLGAADLSPAAVAAAHHISLRTLHRLFHDQGQGETVASYIRHRRLSHARRDLADPSLAARPVHAIAARWGFPQAPDFTRAFRAEYGTTPTEYRRERLHASRQR
ncbi:helix-turn-helix domain-containing protein (plasmid) [Streptomyces longwoodensis]|uniref:AraC-like ligand-binding domain-containing protein n=1 Tax=Streptomyces longwoodensis TaxID=68231 RepID=UPI002F918D0A|nr:helix-turn-helix domain-containing protein [Streptomyces longwoodensis]